jgi:hypothetical protein
MATNLNNPKAISEAGEKIYAAKYKVQYERDYNGKFVAINILDESATLGNSGTEALSKARESYPKGIFHLIRVGHSGAFEVGTSYRHVDTDRLLR